MLLASDELCDRLQARPLLNITDRKGDGDGVSAHTAFVAQDLRAALSPTVSGRAAPGGWRPTQTRSLFLGVAGAKSSVLYRECAGEVKFGVRDGS